MVAASDELQEKKRLLQKARKPLSNVFKEDPNKRKTESGSPLSGSPSPSAAELAGKGDKAAETGPSVMPNVGDSLGPATNKTARPSSSISGNSAVGSITSTSSETGSQFALPLSNANSTEQLYKKASASTLSRRSSGNIPPPKKRQSLDSASRGTVASGRSLNRSTSLWARQNQRQESSSESAAEFQDRYLRNFGHMSERQKALSVKRARKMTQLFGQEPPPDLIQIKDDREDELFRDSMSFSTLVAIAPPLQDHANAVGTVGHEDEGGDERPSTPLPFSTLRSTDDAESSTSNNFQDRRRRAAKLSRFFGVGFQDILMPEKEPTLPAAKVEVDIKVSGRRFWGFGDRPKDSDMHEAIQKLRGLKAT